MGLKRFVSDIHEVQRNLSELLAENTAEEEAARLQIAQGASRFSRRASKVVDDKLSFSATLMRAGEVNAATRLLAEVQEEVLTEEVALIETVNEVRVAQAVRRGRITRLRLARSLAAAMLGACLLAFSAMGMAVASALQDRDKVEEPRFARLRTNDAAAAAEESRKGISRSVRRLVRRLQIGDVKLVLTAGEYRTLTQLTGGDVDEAGLNDVVALLSGTLADKVERAIAVASDTADTVASSLAIEPGQAVKKMNRAKKRATKPADQQTPPADESQEPAEQPADENEQEPEPSPSPSEREKDGDAGEDPDESGELGGLPGGGL